MNTINKQLPLFIRFCTVGAGNTLIDFFGFFLFVSLDFPYLFSQIAAFTVGMLNSFVWNRLWTFRVRQKVRISEIIRFVLINTFALITVYAVLTLLKEEMNWSLLWSKGAATAVGVCMTFLGSRFWVFRGNINQHKLQEG